MSPSSSEVGVTSWISLVEGSCQCFQLGGNRAIAHDANVQAAMPHLADGAFNGVVYPSQVVAERTAAQAR